MSEPAVLVEKEGRVLLGTLNRPEKRNAINCESMCRLYDAWKELDRDDELCAAILAAEGFARAGGTEILQGKTRSKTGQLHLAILVTRLVGMQMARSTEERSR